MIGKLEFPKNFNLNNDIQKTVFSQLTSIKERNPSRFKESVNSILDFLK